MDLVSPEAYDDEDEFMDYDGDDASTWPGANYGDDEDDYESGKLTNKTTTKTTSTTTTTYPSEGLTGVLTLMIRTRFISDSEVFVVIVVVFVFVFVIAIVFLLSSLLLSSPLLL